MAIKDLKEVKASVLQTAKKEFQEFEEECKKLSKDELFLKAYEITYKTEILGVLQAEENADRFSENTWTYLDSFSSPISWLYDIWLKTEDDIFCTLEDMIENAGDEDDLNNL